MTRPPAFNPTSLPSHPCAQTQRQLQLSIEAQGCYINSLIRKEGRLPPGIKIPPGGGCNESAGGGRYNESPGGGYNESPCPLSAGGSYDESAVVMIGDDVRDDVGGAQRAGLRGILVQTGEAGRLGRQAPAG